MFSIVITLAAEVVTIAGGVTAYQACLTASAWVNGWLIGTNGMELGKALKERKAATTEYGR